MHLIPVWCLPHEVSGVRQPERNRVLVVQVQALWIEWDGFVNEISNRCGSANEWEGARGLLAMR